MLKIVDSTMEQHEGAKLRKIFLDIGRGSTIEPVLLSEASARRSR
jgi:Zn finger protein HypA/HybF involved in hydrogenase expression